MSLSSTEFQCVVLGDEPAGLWALRRLAQLEPQWLERGELLWIRFGAARPRPLVAPVRLVGRFGTRLGASWVAELKLPSRTLRWDAEGLSRAVPELPPPVDLPEVGTRLKFPTPYVAAVRNALRLRPELLAYASGIWKFAGRARRLQAETMTLMALQCRELAWWDAAAELPAGVREEVFPPRTAPPEGLSSRGRRHTLTFRGLGPVSSKRWIFNLPWHRLHTLAASCPAIAALMTGRDPRAPLALCPLRLRVDAAAIPWTARPLTIVYDTDEIPDVDGELWPLSLRDAGPERELEAWATVSRDVALEATLAGLRDAYGRVARLFPFVDDGLRGVEVPLSIESCFSEAQRDDVLDVLESALVERYDFTSIQVETRKKSIWALMPSLHCHLPYPLGPMLEASRIVAQIVGRKKIETATAMQLAAG